MAYIITDECIACGSCEDECPVEAISEGEDNTRLTPNCARIAGLARSSVR
jgi:ferredoxin